MEIAFSIPEDHQLTKALKSAPVPDSEVSRVNTDVEKTFVEYVLYFQIRNLFHGFVKFLSDLLEVDEFLLAEVVGLAIDHHQDASLGTGLVEGYLIQLFV